jgi:hypothetical protein
MGDNGTTREGATDFKHFVYQHINTLDGKAPHLALHLGLAAGAFERIYGFEPTLDQREIAAQIARVVRENHAGARTSAIVTLRIAPAATAAPAPAATSAPSASDDDTLRLQIEFNRGLLEAGYSHSPLRPRGATFDYDIPFNSLPTNLGLAARDLFDDLAMRTCGATRSVRRCGNHLLSCGEAPLFAIRGRVLLTPSIEEGGVECVERELLIDFVSRAESRLQSRLEVREEPIRHTELKTFDELFFVDASGLTSFSECDGAKFTSLVAPRLAELL